MKEESVLVVSRTLRPAIPGPCAVALGFFDGIHLGHRAVIDAALAEKSRGLRTCVFTFTVGSQTPAAKASMTLLQTEEQKWRTLERLGVDGVVAPDFSLFKAMSPEVCAVDVLAGALGARVGTCGYDFRFGRGAAGDPETLRDLLKPLGTQVRVVPAVLDEQGVPVSSTRVRQAVADGDAALAARLMGHPFAIDFPVAAGRRLGRKLNFPTINQAFPPGFQIPRFGVYATRVTVDGRSFCGATNIGVKPTVDGAGAPLAETHIVGFEGDLYGRRVLVELIAFLRPETRFDTLERLRRAIAEDARRAQALCGCETIANTALNPEKTASQLDETPCGRIK
jgi:riboflavin kinase/FMN adenylyltransferase